MSGRNIKKPTNSAEYFKRLNQSITDGSLHLEVTEATSPPLLHDRRSAAKMLSISVRSLDYLISRKQLATRRIGRKVMIPHGELVRYARGDHPERIGA